MKTLTQVLKEAREAKGLLMREVAASISVDTAMISKFEKGERKPSKLTQYWRVDSGKYDPSLQVRVNGRAKYWSGGTADKNNYIAIPGGPAFENFELRENYHSGQTFYFGLSLKSAKDLISGF